MKNITILTTFFLFIFFIGNAISPSPFNLNQEEILKNTHNISFKNNLHFHGSANSSIYIVKISSPYKIYIDNLTYQINGTIDANTSRTWWNCFLVTNKTSIQQCWGHARYISNEGLRYFHFKFDSFNFTYDNRNIKNLSLSNSRLIWTKIFELIPIPAGEWYLIFAGSFFDIEPENYELNISVWINFSSKCRELRLLSTAKGEKVHALWYGEFDSNLIISYCPSLELMIRGRAKFHINNTFIYDLWGFPFSQGLLKTKWIKPGGEIDKRIYYCRHGSCFPFPKPKIGGPGDYQFIISYWDRVSMNIFHHSRWVYPWPLYFIGLDVKLP
jgi:hypothetical protein